MSDDSAKTKAGKSTGSTIPAPPIIEGGRDVYNRIMGQIETDLTTDHLPRLDEKYRDESPADFKARMKRYAAAFAEYQKQYTFFQKKREAHAKTYGKGIMKQVESKSHHFDEESLVALESAFSQV